MVQNGGSYRISYTAPSNFMLLLYADDKLLYKTYKYIYTMFALIASTYCLIGDRVLKCPGPTVFQGCANCATFWCLPGPLTPSLIPFLCHTYLLQSSL